MKKSVCFLLLIIFFTLPFSVFAQESTTSAEPSSTPSSTPTVDYTLPYPGLLPDSPLYSLKVLRDNIIGFLISDPLKKSQFDLLQADKRVEGAYTLYNQHQDSVGLVETTISKAENYFENAIGKAQEAKKQGMSVDDIERRLSLANRKHNEIVIDLEKRVNKNAKARFTQLKQRIEKLGQSVKELTSK